MFICLTSPALMCPPPVFVRWKRMSNDFWPKTPSSASRILLRWRLFAMEESVLVYVCMCVQLVHWRVTQRDEKIPDHFWALSEFFWWGVLIVPRGVSRGREKGMLWRVFFVRRVTTQHHSSSGLRQSIHHLCIFGSTVFLDNIPLPYKG